MTPRSIPGSFRDPSGRVYEADGRIFRTIADQFASSFDFVESTGLFQRLMQLEWLLPFAKVDPRRLDANLTNVRYLLEVPRLPFVSYPYEWSFPALKAAALQHLEIQLTALEYACTLSDASAYNVQFRGARPVFIDHLSFRRYHAGELWAGHRQFCEQFLNPLLLRAFFGISHNAWYRGTQEGITAEELSRLLKGHHYFRPAVLTHVVLQSYLQRSVQRSRLDLTELDIPAVALPLSSFKRLLRNLHSWIKNLRAYRAGQTVWQNYTRIQSYSLGEVESKTLFVTDFVKKENPKLIWDLGCNTGDYCLAALRAGAEYAVGFDYDQGVLDLAFARARENNLPFQALFLDAANPHPNQGWKEKERSGLRTRASADAVLALAFIHHLTFTRNIPLEDLLDWILDLAPSGIIEFIPKNDLMVQSLLRHREDIFSTYTKEAFLNHIACKAKIIDTAIVSASGRLLVSWRKV